LTHSSADRSNELLIIRIKPVDVGPELSLGRSFPSIAFHFHRILPVVLSSSNSDPVVIGRTSRSFPHSKPDVRLSPHPAFQIEPGYSQRADQTRCLCVSGTHQGIRVTRPSTFLPFPCEVCWLWFRGNGGHSVYHTSRCRKALSWRTFTLSGPLQTGL